ncbi:calcium-binding protein [Microvirga sp. 2TAF3]|uniref:calcium-binding protein n=1 Tax=Microvirga sp. 2TAF3 TaxID=3233014 RepID=UPI003F9E3C39
MSKAYNQLAAFMRANKSDPLSLAKIMTGWLWTSLLPAGAGPEPTSAKSVPTVMNASCGWRDTLMESLFEGIGVQHRRVNFYDVPFQANHTATELFINGKWMFFDSTFGLYFTRQGSSVPLSMEEARALWPNVVTHQSSLKGWQGVFVDPKTISAKAYHTTDDTFAYAPVNYSHADGVVAGELYALYFVKNATYLDDSGEKLIDGDARSWKITVDSNNSKSWLKNTYFYDQNGRVDAQYMLMDNKSHVFTHWDRDDHYDWLKKTTKVTAFSRLEQTITLYDDRSKDVISYDAKSAQPWSSFQVHYSTNGKIDYAITHYDDGQVLETEYDETGSFTWSQYGDVFDASGQVTSTTITYDDGTVKFYNWATASKISGTAGNDVLTGTHGVDALFGGEGNDTLISGAETVRLEGGKGNDVYYVHSTSDIVVERSGGGHDTVISSENYILGRNVEDLVLTDNAIYGTGQELNNWVVGNARDNVLTGGGGNDRLIGMEGNDLLIGGTGNDVLEGGLGTDTLYGGPGADTFLWRSVEEIGSWLKDADIVKDFSAAQGDKLSFNLIDADTTRPGKQSFTFIGNDGFSAPGQIRYAFSGKETLIYLNTDADPSGEAVLRLAGKVKPDASWFIL